MLQSFLKHFSNYLKQKTRGQEEEKKLETDNSLLSW